ncbi:MAG: ATP-binding cassette domain-containing protein [Desulfobacterales bacterium]
MAAGVEARGIAYRDGSGELLLRDLTLRVDPGTYAVVFGENGAGKSTFAYLLSGLIPHFFGGDLQGEIRLNGLDPRRLGPAELFHRVGLVLQNTDAQLFGSTVEADLAFGLQNLGLSPTVAASRIAAAARDLGIEHLLWRPPEALSGGERRLAAIASVRVLDPEVLVLDEPFADLDWVFRGRVERLLAELHAGGRTVLVLEHREGAFLEDAEVLLVFEQGSCTASGPAREARRQLAAKGLLPSYPPRPPGGGATGEPLLSAEGLRADLGGATILSSVSLALRAGEVVALVGRNGAGKSSLLRVLAGIARPTAGRVRIGGEDLFRFPPRERALRVGICFQNPNDQFFRATVREELEVGFRLRGKGPVDDASAAACWPGIEAILDRSPHRLSEGGKKQAAIAAVLAAEPAVLLLDEPTVSQDARGKEALARRIGDLARRGAAVLVATHDLSFAAAVAHRAILLERGKVQAEGTVEEIAARLTPAAAAGEGTGGPTPPAPRPAGRELHPFAGLALLAAGLVALLTAREAVTQAGVAAWAAALLVFGTGGPAQGAAVLRRSGGVLLLAAAGGLLFFGPAEAGFLLLRLVGLLSVSAACLGALSPEALAAALHRLRVPEGVGFLLTAGMRYVPRIENALRAIRDAQQARGIDLRLRPGNLARLTALFVPLLVQGLRLADELALAMEARGISSPRRRPPELPRFSRRDGLLLAGGLLPLLALAAREFFAGG